MYLVVVLVNSSQQLYIFFHELLSRLSVDSAMVTDINARVLRRIVLVVVINVNSPQVAPTQTLLPPSRLVILVDDDQIVITGLVLLLLGVEDDVLLHLVAGAVVITGLLLLKNYISTNHLY